MGLKYDYVKDRFVAADEAVISVRERGFRYGDGIFETVRIHNGIPYQWELHLARLTAGLAYARIPFDASKLAPLVHTLLERNEVDEGLLRLSISRGEGERGYLPEPDLTPTLVMETLPLPPPPAGAITLWHSTYRAPPYAGHKTMQGLLPTLARLEADEEGCQEALLCDASGHIIAGTSCAIFWLKGGTLHHPSPATGAIAGTTLAAAIRLLGIPVKPGAYPLSELQQADAVLVANVTWLALPVTALKPQGWNWRSEDTARRLRDLLMDDMEAYAARTNF